MVLNKTVGAILKDNIHAIVSYFVHLGYARVYAARYQLKSDWTQHKYIHGFLGLPPLKKQTRAQFHVTTERRHARDKAILSTHRLSQSHRTSFLARTSCRSEASPWQERATKTGRSISRLRRWNRKRRPKPAGGTIPTYLVPPGTFRICSVSPS